MMIWRCVGDALRAARRMLTKSLMSSMISVNANQLTITRRGNKWVSPNP